MKERILSISEAAKQLGVETHVLRYWEEELDIEVPRNEMGHRLYGAHQMQLLHSVKELKMQGFQLRAIKLLLHEWENGEQPDINQIVAMREEINRKVEAMNQSETVPDYRGKASQPEAAADYRGKVNQPEAAADYRGKISQPEAATDYRGKISQSEAVTDYRGKISQPEAAADYRGKVNQQETVSREDKAAYKQFIMKKVEEDFASYDHRKSKGAYRNNNVGNEPQESMGAYRNSDIGSEPQESMGAYRNSDIGNEAQESMGAYQNRDAGSEAREAMTAYHSTKSGQAEYEYNDSRLERPDHVRYMPVDYRNQSQPAKYQETYPNLNQFQYAMLKVMNNVLQENTAVLTAEMQSMLQKNLSEELTKRLANSMEQVLGDHISDEVSTRVIKEMNYLTRMQEEREEAYFQQLNGVLGIYQEGIKECASAKQRKKMKKKEAKLAAAANAEEKKQSKGLFGWKK